MKKLFSIGCIAMVLIAASCNEEPKSGTHTHEDGSTHADHDTTKPAQQEFKVGDSTHQAADTSKEHTHADGKKHSH